MGAAIHFADQGDTQTLWGTLAETVVNLAELDEDDPQNDIQSRADRRGGKGADRKKYDPHRAVVAI